MAILQNIIKWIVVFSVILIVQTTVVPKIAILGAFPDLPLILLFLVSTRYGGLVGIWGGFSLGLFIDVFSAGLLGANALAKTLVGASAGLIDRKKMTLDPVLQLVFLFLVVILHDIIIYVLNVRTDGGNALMQVPGFLFSSALPRAIYTTIVAGLVFFVWDFFQAKSSRR